MSPYTFVKQATENGESLLSLGCGIGLEFKKLNTHNITGVDIVPEYLTEVRKLYPHVKTFCSDVREYAKNCAPNSVDVVSLMDVIEHLDKKSGRALLEDAKRIATKQVLVFTPEGFVKNEPHNAWGIDAGDEHQKHISGWSVLEIKDMGFDLLDKWDDVSQHGKPYTALMFSWTP